MTAPRPKRPSLGTVLGLTALVVALAGTADAGPTHVLVRKGDIAKGAVTARALAKGAVRARALAKGAVTAKALKQGAVDSEAIGADAVGAAAIRRGAVSSDALGANAVTSAALAPGSVYGAALGPITVHFTPMADLDTVPSNPEWTASNTGTALCDPGERVLTGGVFFPTLGNREVAIIQSLPITGSSPNGYAARITSNSGGTAAAEVQAICLK
jgi:hypothetical protein